MLADLSFGRQDRSTSNPWRPHLGVRLRWSWNIVNWIWNFLTRLYSLPFTFSIQFIMSNDRSCNGIS